MKKYGRLTRLFLWSLGLTPQELEEAKAKRKNESGEITEEKELIDLINKLGTTLVVLFNPRGHYQIYSHTPKEGGIYVEEHGWTKLNVLKYSVDLVLFTNTKYPSEGECYVVKGYHTRTFKTDRHQIAEFNGKSWDFYSIPNEFILCAAIYFDDGIKRSDQPINISSGFVICGHGHGQCCTTAYALNMDPAAIKKENFGFVTNLNRFVGRKEAWQIANVANQIKYGKEASDNGDESILISENLY